IVQVEGREVKMNEVSQAVELVRDICAKEANIVFGHAIVPELKDQLQVTIIATGFNRGAGAPQPQPQQQPMPQQPSLQPMMPQNPAMQPRQMPTQPAAPQQMPQGNVPPLFAPQYRQQPQRPLDDDGYVSMDDDSEQSWLDKLKRRR
ncbi:MAG: hypothetical protein K2O39_06640, partial [Clostridiales bacterium]|nr:hypothetical protein [Clostridiales bacterium]